MTRIPGNMVARAETFCADFYPMNLDTSIFFGSC